jgi:hypothetical protein
MSRFGPYVPDRYEHLVLRTRAYFSTRRKIVTYLPG